MTKKVWLIIFSLLMIPSFGSADKGEKRLYEKNSLYQYIVVAEDTKKQERYMYNSKYVHAGMSLEDPDRLLFEYTRMSFISLAFLDRKPEDVLFVGLGAGSMPRYFNRYCPEVKTDVVEIDPEVVDVAKEYFYFQETPNMKVHVQDGRIFIKRTGNKYDMVFLDAYQTDHIPFHLTTVEFLREVRKKLKDGGVVISHVSSSSTNKFFYSMIKTYQEAFPHLYVFKGRSRNNFVFIATDDNDKLQENDILKRAKEFHESKGFDFNLPMMAFLYGYSDEFEWGGEILTDDFAPVNLLRHMEVK